MYQDVCNLLLLLSLFTWSQNQPIELSHNVKTNWKKDSVNALALKAVTQKIRTKNRDIKCL